MQISVRQLAFTRRPTTIVIDVHFLLGQAAAPHPQEMDARAQLTRFFPVAMRLRAAYLCTQRPQEIAIKIAGQFSLLTPHQLLISLSRAFVGAAALGANSVFLRCPGPLRSIHSQPCHSDWPLIETFMRVPETYRIAIATRNLELRANIWMVRCFFGLLQSGWAR